MMQEIGALAGGRNLPVPTVPQIKCICLSIRLALRLSIRLVQMGCQPNRSIHYIRGHSQVIKGHDMRDFSIATVAT